MALEEFMKEQELSSSTRHLDRFMRTLFRKKLEDDERIRKAEASGAGLEAKLFADLEPAKETAAGSTIEDLFPATPPTTGESAPIEVTDENIGVATKRRWKIWVFLLLLVAALTVAGYRFHPEIPAFLEKLTGKAEPTEKPEPAPTVTTGTVNVESQPTGASVALDGKQRAKTPCKLANIQVGIEHRLKISAPGHEPWTIRFTLEKEGEVKTMNTSLTKLPETPQEKPKEEPIEVKF
jgi:hypothetical protein